MWDDLWNTSSYIVWLSPSLGNGLAHLERTLSPIWHVFSLGGSLLTKLNKALYPKLTMVGLFHELCAFFFIAWGSGSICTYSLPWLFSVFLWSQFHMWFSITSTSSSTISKSRSSSWDGSSRCDFFFLESLDEDRLFHLYYNGTIVNTWKLHLSRGTLSFYMTLALTQKWPNTSLLLQ